MKRWSRIMLPAMVLLCLAAMAPAASAGKMPAPHPAPKTPTADYLEWNELPPLPDSMGFAGGFSGLVKWTDASGNAQAGLLFAGGARFPELPAKLEAEKSGKTLDAPKRYYDSLYLLTRTAEERSGAAKLWDKVRGMDTAKYTYTWTKLEGKLPAAAAYGGCAQTKAGLVILGGEAKSYTKGADGKLATKLTVYDTVYLASCDGKTVTFTQLASLPEPLTCPAVTASGNTVYVLGGMGDKGGKDVKAAFYSLDAGTKDAKWETLAWPKGALARSHAVAVVQFDGTSNKLFLFGGRRELDPAKLPTDSPGKVVVTSLPYAAEFFSDTWKYDPENKTWKQMADMPMGVSAGSVATIGQAHVFILTGATGENMANWHKGKLDFGHPGFLATPLAYHTVTDTWIIEEQKIPESPTTAAALKTHLGDKAADHPTPRSQVTTKAVNWGDDVFLVSGEVRPMVRTPAAWKISIKTKPAAFGWVNYATLGIYLLSMVGIGVYFASKNKNTDDFFRGGQSIPWWAAACSIYATMLSSITYVALPALAFKTNWAMWLGQLTILPVSLFVIWKVLPFFRQIDATSAYEYLEKRFGYVARAVGSLLFIIFQIGRMAVVMYLPALALQAVTGLSPVTCILIMGVLSIAYCTMGGIEAVIWTDTIQTFILIGGALVSVVMLWNYTGGDFSSLMQTSEDYGKLTLMTAESFGSKSYMIAAVWVVILGGLFQNLSSYSSDQAVVQRYMTTSSQKKAANAILTNGIMCIPASLIFFLIGTLLFIYYRQNPAELNPQYRADAIFPLFIATKMPIGIAGLVVAGIFAAAQSTLSTSMNSLSTVIVTDFARPMNFCKTEKGYLNLARWMTALLGVLGTTAAIVLALSNIYDAFSTYVSILGMFMGVLAGMFLLGMFTKRCNTFGCVAAGAITAVVMCMLKFGSTIFIFGEHDLHQTSGYLYPALSICLCMVLGLILSMLSGGNKKDTHGLTVFNMLSKEEAAE